MNSPYVDIVQLALSQHSENTCEIILTYGKYVNHNANTRKRHVKLCQHLRIEITLGNTSKY